MSPALAAASLAQCALLVLVGWAAGDWLLASTHARNQNDEDRPELGWPERALIGAAGFVALSVGLMVLHIVLGGLVFGVTGVVPAVAVALVAIRRRRLARLGSLPWRRLAVFIVLATLVWSLPTLLSGTAARSGDIPWHLGWTEQLLAGEPVPEGPAPEEVAQNAYPWGFHAVLATLVRLVPGSDVLSALVALQLILMAAIPLSAACLARRIDARAGWAAAAVTAFVGGFGWLLAREPAFATSPADARYGADLVVASPNAVYGLFPPPLPRELGLLMLAAAAVLLAVALTRASNRGLVLSGLFLGCAGLVSVPAMVAGVAWTVAAVLLAGTGSRPTVLARALLPAVIVFGLWAGPVVRAMLVNGGLVNVTPTLGQEWPLWTALGSWGLLLPLVVVGALAARRFPGAAAVGSFGLATIVLLGLALARGMFDWPLAGNATVLHQGRMWPIAHLLAGAVGGVGLWHVARRVGTWRRLGGRALAGALLVLGAVSPALASVSLSRTMIAHEGGYSYRSSDLDEGSFMRQAAQHLDPDDTIAVRGASPAGRALALHLFSFSGARLAEYDDPRLESNDLRIRFLDLAEEWDERARESNFPVDYEIRRIPEGSADEQALVSGEFADASWALSRPDDAGGPVP